MEEQENKLLQDEEIIMEPRIGEAASIVTSTLKGTVEMDVEEQKKIAEQRKSFSTWTTLVEEIQFFHERLMPNWASAEDFDRAIKEGDLRDIDRVLDDLKNVSLQTDDTASQMQANYLSKAIALDAYSSKLNDCENLSDSDLRYLNGFSFNPLSQRKMSNDELTLMMERNFEIAKASGLVHCGVAEEGALKQHMLEKLQKMNNSGLAPMLRKSYKAMNDQKASLEVQRILRESKADQAKNYSDSIVEASRQVNKEKSDSLYDREPDYELEDTQSLESITPEVESRIEAENEQKAKSNIAAATGVAVANEIKMQSEKKKEQKSFTKPTVEEVKTYAHQIGYFSIDCEKFVNYYNEKGWKTKDGLNITDWKKQIATWQKRQYHFKDSTGAVAKQAINSQQIDMKKVVDGIDAGLEIKPNMKAFAPTKEEVEQFFAEKKLTINADNFYKKYSGNGWKINDKFITTWRGLAINENKMNLSNQKKVVEQKVVQKPIFVDEGPAMSM